MIDTYEKISGKASARLLEQLVEDRSLVHFQLPQIDLSGLTVIKRIRKRWLKPFFLIDVPDGMWQSVRDVKNLNLRFEFSGRDRLKYRFTTYGGKSLNDEIWISFPQFIERIQQRENFRLEPKTKIAFCFDIAGGNHEMRVINISEGGALMASGPRSTQTARTPELAAGSYLSDVRLRMHFKNKNLSVTIKRVLVKRAARDAARHRYFFGLQFVEIDPAEKDKLVHLIYQMQQDFLRKRLPAKN